MTEETTIAAGVFISDDSEAIIKHWVATDVLTNPKIQREIQEFVNEHGIESVEMSDGNMGCPHERATIFPLAKTVRLPLLERETGNQSVVLRSDPSGDLASDVPHRS